jgi:radical SAM superfamily enzyme YgiQ (UPF0313 family)
MESHGYRVLVIDSVANTRDSMLKLLRLFLSLRTPPVAVGISAYTVYAEQCAILQRFARQMAPQAKVILGGPHATVCYQELLANPDTDVVVRGEGESTMIEVLEGIRHPGYGWNRIRGIAYRDSSGAVHCNPDRPPIRLLDQLPIPAYDLVDDDPAGQSFNLLSTRGCPGRCIFCAVHVTIGPLTRAHSAEWIFSMIYARYKKRPFTVAHVLDDTFTFDRRRVLTFCGLLSRWPVKLKWGIGTRVDFLSEDVVRALAKAGCVAVHIGIESADDAVLKSIGKGITLAQVRGAIQRLLENGILPSASFILGHPTDTLETIEKTVLFGIAVRELAFSVSCTMATPLPGTLLQQRAADLGIQIVERDWHSYTFVTPIYEAPGFTLKDLTKAAFLFKSSSFYEVPATLLSGIPDEAFRTELAVWVQEMKRLRRKVQETGAGTEEHCLL